MGKREVINIGESVVCDSCSDDYTGLPDTGGFLFGSYAICPKCVPGYERDVKKFHEEHLIKARCPEGTPFAQWVLGLRGGNNEIVIESWDPK